MMIAFPMEILRREALIRMYCDKALTILFYQHILSPYSLETSAAKNLSVACSMNLLSITS